MINRQLLEELASAYAIAPSYISAAGETVVVEDDTLIQLIQAMGISLSDEPDDEELTLALYEDYLDRSSRPLPPAVVGPQGIEHSFVVHVHDGDPAEVIIHLEDGSTRPAYQDPNDAPAVTVGTQTWGEASFHVPGDLPQGYHELELRSPGLGTERCALIITPPRLSTADPFIAAPGTGIMAQLYSVRSAGSWGMGDFHDLGLLAQLVAEEAGADFLLINPLHAAEPQPPIEDSPYLPTTRRWINPIYLRIEDIPELALVEPELREEIEQLGHSFNQRNTSSAHIDRDAIFAAKLAVLRELYAVEFMPARQEAFEAFLSHEGEDLLDFGRWCARRDIAALHLEAGGAGRHAFAPDIEDSARFYAWLQFLCNEQLGAAQSAARGAGMRIGIVTDLAVGIHPGGADAENLAQYLAPDASVGAPPDLYNQLGQDWSQPPWHPVRLAKSGYRPWRDLVESQLRNAGGVRIDHILGMFRLYWIPRMRPATAGSYIRYDYEAMLGIVALEAQRAGTVVIGEDMGTVEPWVQEVLAEKSILGTTVVWFEHDDNDPTQVRAQQDFRAWALGAVGTHDMPPTLSYIRGGHIELREQLQVLTTDVAEETAEDMAWQSQVFRALAENGYLTDADPQLLEGQRRPTAEEEPAIMAALHAYISDTPAVLTVSNLVDLVGDIRAQNQPGTTKEVYPNWCIPLCNDRGEAVLIEDLRAQKLFEPVSTAARRSI